MHGELKLRFFGDTLWVIWFGWGRKYELNHRFSSLTQFFSFLYLTAPSNLFTRPSERLFCPLQQEFRDLQSISRQKLQKDYRRSAQDTNFPLQRPSSPFSSIKLCQFPPETLLSIAISIFKLTNYDSELIANRFRLNDESLK